ncbi:MAG: penicillin-binding transpeptidase domain-containing protein [candidate division KSB1 bacterium]|nr:penicillin-binding transpeptidase domain-containing protein [candidate division KSB1 bacterium]MDZ7301562.1 penicillin-binding transpeptidase domain-containing protein [candidate division KSB1 bacterium]MDZ7311022.1 penicillin-binding transpeptidase domain-containing protein [candidate division KSB1 bacterium]
MLTLEIFFLCFGLVVVVRLVYIQVWQREKYRKMAKVQHLSEIPLLAQRGLIYDRNQNLLALNEACVSVGLDLRLVKDRAAYAEKLAPLLGTSTAALRGIMKGERNFVWLRRRVDPDLAQKINALKLPGVRLEKDTRRRYPHDESAAHILGYTDVDNRGIAGIELACDSLLRGINGRKVIQRDAIGNLLPEVSIPEIQPVNGKSLILTIDYILQTIAGEELRSAMQNFAASAGIVIISNPLTGEILAMICEPGFNPNYPAAYSIATRRNRAITDLYEPGSTFKLVTFAGIFQEHKRRPEDLVFCEHGVYSVAGEVVKDHEKYGNLAVHEVLTVSSNIGTIKLARLLGSTKFFQYARDFGFGMVTGLELEGEVSGVLKNPVQWSGFTLPAMAMGYEVAVTPLQMVMAYGAIANGGLLLRPKILAGMIEPSGGIQRFHQPEVVRRVVSPPVAHLMTNLLKDVVDHGTGKSAAIPGIPIAGKTGTAHKPLANGRGYARDDYIASFIGFFPADHPRYLIFVMLENPRTTYWGGFVAAPTFKKIAQRILAGTSLKEQRTMPEKMPEMPDPNVPTVIVPDVTGRSVAISTAILEKIGLKVTSEGRGDFVLNQNPLPGTPVKPRTKVLLNLFEIEQTRATAKNKMPNLVGLSVREALRRLALLKLDAYVHGSGRVVRQYPDAGATISADVHCELECQAMEPAIKTTAVH